jgi:hypothetical protein
MRIAQPCAQSPEYCGYSRGPINGHLLTNAQVQAHMQERVGAAILNREIGLEITADRGMILGMLSDHGGDLRLKWR